MSITLCSVGDGTAQLMRTVEDKSRLHMTLFHTLRKLCGQHRKLPTQYDLWTQNPGSDDVLITTSKHPVAWGGFANVWLGEHKGQQVAIKEFRIHGHTDQDAIERVSNIMRASRYSLLIHEQTKHADVLQGGRLMEASISPQRHTVHRRRREVIHARYC